MDRVSLKKNSAMAITIPGLGITAGKWVATGIKVSFSGSSSYYNWQSCPARFVLTENYVFCFHWLKNNLKGIWPKCFIFWKFLSSLDN